MLKEWLAKIFWRLTAENIIIEIKEAEKRTGMSAYNLYYNKKISNLTSAFNQK